ncbi:choice-of-anchor V domain-containing protein [Pseudotenacibaculum haliotis]|uniref:Choice-of-anchor V domain-containing protein n=1 Tax=Pseudotenacibaculum haliotis TaxID=1862138 RepID=A0ABW5LNS5_9FLAO
MKKNYLFKLTLFFIPVLALFLMSNAGGRFAPASGSPGDGGATCVACHNGGNFNASATITTNIPVTGYELNTVYNVTVTANSTAPAHGFQLTAERDSDNGKMGTLIAGSGSQLVNSDGNITHTNPNQSSWTFSWRSPTTDEGTVSFYAAVNAANGNGQAFDGSDQVVTTSSSSPSLSISEARLLKFEMYPNPSSDEVTIQLPSGTEKAKVGVFDYTGRLISSQEVTSSNRKVDVTNLVSGIYIIRVTADNKIGAQRFIKS